MGITLSTKIHYANKPLVEEYADVCLWSYRELFADKIFVIHKDEIKHWEPSSNFHTKSKFINMLLKIVLVSVQILTFIPGIILGVLPKIYAHHAYDQVKEAHKKVNDYLQQLDNKKNLLNKYSSKDRDQLDNSMEKKLKNLTDEEIFKVLMESDLDKEKLFPYANEDLNNSPTLKLALMTKVAKMGHIEAAFLVGQMYRWGVYYQDDRKGKEIEINIPEALIWLKKAALAGYGKAYGNLATIYFYGEGVPEDKVEAKKVLLRGFQNGAEYLSLQGKINSQGFKNPEDVEYYFNKLS